MKTIMKAEIASETIKSRIQTPSPGRGRAAEITGPRGGKTSRAVSGVVLPSGLEGADMSSYCILHSAHGQLADLMRSVVMGGLVHRHNRSSVLVAFGNCRRRAWRPEQGTGVCDLLKSRNIRIGNSCHDLLRQIGG